MLEIILTYRPLLIVLMSHTILAKPIVTFHLPLRSDPDSKFVALTLKHFNLKIRSGKRMLLKIYIFLPSVSASFSCEIICNFAFVFFT